MGSFIRLLELPSLREFSASSEIDTAIEACKEEKNDQIYGRMKWQKIKGSLCDDYCDVLGNVGDLVRLREFDTQY